jgi:hypothetical protein
MIALNVGVEFGGYHTAYTAELPRWPMWPVDAKLVVKVTPLGLELRVVFGIEGFKMEFTIAAL